MNNNASKATAFSEQEFVNTAGLLCTKTEMLSRLKGRNAIDQAGDEREE